MKNIMLVFGTRPEAIKLAPVALELQKQPEVKTTICVTAQHRQMLDQVLGLFDLKPDIDLDLMQPNQTLSELTARVLARMDETLSNEKPDTVVIQGDTTTVMATAMAAFYRQIRVAHVEAGLRSGDMRSPFPEEMNRRVATTVSELHFAPTKAAVNALQKEGVPSEKIFLTGNSVIDALKLIVDKPIPKMAKDLLEQLVIDKSSSRRKLILVTAHRRENFGPRLESICEALKALALRNGDVVILYPVHLNPNVYEPVHRILGGLDRVMLTEPLTYDVLAHLMKASYLALTDSGGIQEEAPSLGKPVLVMRTETERPEGVKAGTAKLVGPFAENIIRETEILLYDETAYHEMSRAINPYGDGKAARRIVDVLMTGNLADTEIFGGDF